MRAQLHLSCEWSFGRKLALACEAPLTQAPGSCACGSGALRMSTCALLSCEWSFTRSHLLTSPAAWFRTGCGLGLGTPVLLWVMQVDICLHTVASFYFAFSSPSQICFKVVPRSIEGIMLPSTKTTILHFEACF